MWFKRDIIVLISFLILFVSISFLVNIGKEMFLPGFRTLPGFISLPFLGFEEIKCMICVSILLATVCIMYI